MSLIGKFVAPWGIGAYPVEYSRPVHGPYDPSRYYGKRKQNHFALAPFLLKKCDISMLTFSGSTERSKGGPTGILAWPTKLPSFQHG